MKGDNIALRLLEFAKGVIKVNEEISKTVSGKHIGKQLLRAGTSGGANYEEARAAESRADFAHKVGVAAKEMRESLFWLRLVSEAGLADELQVKVLSREASELVAILMSSSKTAKARC